MAKDTATASATPKKVERKTRRQVEKAQTAQQRAARKVGKLQARLRQAESKLAKRVRTLATVQSRIDTTIVPTVTAPRKAKKTKPEAAPAPLKAASKRGKGKADPAATPEQRLASINMVVPGEGVISGTTGAAPVAAITTPPLHTEHEQLVAPVATSPEAEPTPDDEQPHPAQAKSVAARIHRPRADVASAE